MPLTTPRRRSRTSPSKRRILNCVPSRKTDQDWQVSHAISAGLHPQSKRLPRAVDLRAAWWGVSDQGNTGSCVGWATADSVLRWHFVKAKRIRSDERLSPRFLWMAAKETDEFITRPTTFIEVEGTSPKAALNIARGYGAVTERILPFAAGSLYAGETSALYAIASQLRIACFFDLGARADLGDKVDPDAWRGWLAHNGPVLVALDVDANWMRANRRNAELADYERPHDPAGHAVAIVGYARDRFIVRNSWGTSWGDGGFAYATERYATAAFNEAYGVVV